MPRTPATESPGATAPPVLFERRGAVALVSLHRPAQRNAVDAALALALEACVRRVEADDQLRVAVLASSDARVFCAGVDLHAVERGELREIAQGPYGFAGFTQAPRRKPWIAAVRGPALGGGCELVLACDMIVAGESARLSQPEARLGLLAAAGGAYRLPRRLPYSLAVEYLLTGAPIDPVAALQHGLYNRLLPDTDVLAGALALAEAVAESAPGSVQASLALARAALDHSDPALAQLSMDAAARLLDTEDAREGLRAFFEKRRPRWSGGG